MKQIWKLGLLITMVLVMALTFAGQADAAAGYRHAVLFPSTGFAAADSTQATTWADATNWFDLRKWCIDNEATGFRLRVYTKLHDADVDSISVITRASIDGLVTTTIDSSEILGSTQYSSMSKYYTADSAQFFSNKLLTYAKVYGDDAGTAIQTVTLHVTVEWFDKLTGLWVAFHEYDVKVPFQE